MCIRDSRYAEAIATLLAEDLERIGIDVGQLSG